jgi:hypothetical protein
MMLRHCCVRYVFEVQAADVVIRKRKTSDGASHVETKLIYIFNT